MGLRLAHTLMYPEVLDYIGLGHDIFTVEVRASEKIAEKTVADLQLAEHGVQLLVKHQREILAPPPDGYVFRIGDQLVMAGLLSDLRSLSAYL